MQLTATRSIAGISLTTCNGQTSQPNPSNTPPWQLFGQKLLTLNNMEVGNDGTSTPCVLEKDWLLLRSISQPRFKKNKAISASCTFKTCAVGDRGRCFISTSCDASVGILMSISYGMRLPSGIVLPNNSLRSLISFNHVSSIRHLSSSSGSRTARPVAPLLLGGVPGSWKSGPVLRLVSSSILVASGCRASVVSNMNIYVHILYRYNYVYIYMTICV